MGLEEIGYCGLHCGGCPLRTGVVSNPAPDLRKAQRSTAFRGAAEALAAIPFFKVLAGCPVCLEMIGNQVLMRCPRNCRQGGGNPACDIRFCCIRGSLDGCWQCGEFETCEHLQALMPAHGKAHILNLAVIRASGVEGFLAGEKLWYTSVD